MKSIAVVTAMHSEYNTALKALKQIPGFQLKSNVSKNGFKLSVGSASEKEILLIKTGVGIRKAEDGLSFLCSHYEIGLVINAGIAGGLRNDLAIGDLLIGTSFIHEKAPDKEIRLTPKIPSDIKKTGEGKVITVDSPLGDDEKRRYFHKEWGADLVEMEAFALAEKCQAYDIPLMALKAVSDRADSDVKIFSHIFDSTGKIRFSVLLGYLFLRPLTFWRSYLKVLNNSRKAQSVLGDFMVRLIEGVL